MPEAIMIHVPENFFGHGHNAKMIIPYETWANEREKAFRRFYESMGAKSGHDDYSCFYHFISSCPGPEVEKNIQYIYICFRGQVQYKALLVNFMRNAIVDLPTYQHLTPRNWCVTTGPVVKPAEPILLKDVWKGARQGFRYTKELF